MQQLAAPVGHVLSKLVYLVTFDDSASDAEGLPGQEESYPGGARLNKAGNQVFYLVFEEDFEAGVVSVDKVRAFTLPKLTAYLKKRDTRLQKARDQESSFVRHARQYPLG